MVPYTLLLYSRFSSVVTEQSLAQAGDEITGTASELPGVMKCVNELRTNGEMEEMSPREKEAIHGFSPVADLQL